MISRLAVGILLLVVPAAGVAQESQQRNRLTPPASLAPLEWLAGGRWVASSNDPKAPNLMRETYFDWSPNGRALRFWSYTTNKQLQRRPYVEGWYVFHPGRKQVIFSYVDAEGYYAGEVRKQGDVLDHECEGTSATGSVQAFRYTFTKVNADEMIVRIYDRSDTSWRQVVELVYRRQAF